MGSEAASKLALFVCCLALVATAGWAVGRLAGFAAPELAGRMPGFEHLDGVPGHGATPPSPREESP